MEDLESYIQLIVAPTFDAYTRDALSVRHAYLACLVAYHAVDRAAYPDRPHTLIRQWRKESMEFSLVEEVALHLKHVMMMRSDCCPCRRQSMRCGLLSRI